MKPDGPSHKTMVVTDHGRFVWDYALEILEYIPKGKQRSTVSWPLGEDRYRMWGTGGAVKAEIEVMRKIGRILNDTGH